MLRQEHTDHNEYMDGIADSRSCSTGYLHDGRTAESADMRHLEKGAIVFIEGDRPRGVYLIREGRIKITTCTPEGRVLILGVAARGDTLGLSAVLTHSEYEASAEVIEPVIARFVPRETFLARLKRDPMAAVEAAEELGRRYRDAHLMMRSLASTDPVLIRLARLFLRWASNGNGLYQVDGVNGPLQIHNTFTHQQIAEMIGSSRETVTRVLREMRERDLVTLKGAELCIHSPAKLTRLAAGAMDQFCDARHEAHPF